MEDECRVPTDYEWAEWLRVTFRVDLNIMYHRKRERFFTLCDRWAKFASLIVSGAAFSSFLVLPEQKAIASLIVSIFTLLSLLFTWNDKGRLHAELAQKYLALKAQISRTGPRNFTEENIAEWEAQIDVIEQSEPQILHGVLAECHNYIVSRQHEHHKMVTLSARQRFFAHVFDTLIIWPDGTKPKELE